MFVQDNIVSSCLIYVKSRLENQFSSTEIRQIQRQIFEKIFGWSAADLMLNQNYRLTESELLSVRDFVKRLQINEPLQYITGYTEFCDLRIQCDPRALIPRPETEELVYKILSYELSKTPKRKMLDLCTGSGCIALALKSQVLDAEVLAVDFSQDALDLAHENATQLDLDVSLVRADVLEIPDDSALHKHQYDLIVSNPPYIPESDKALMSANVLEHEPHLALFVENDDALIFYERIAAFAKKSLHPAGILAFELHENLSEQVAACCSQNGFSAVEIFEDLQGKPRMLLAHF